MDSTPAPAIILRIGEQWIVPVVYLLHWGKDHPTMNSAAPPFRVKFFEW
jgi:hypothetical protein